MENQKELIQQILENLKGQQSTFFFYTDEFKGIYGGSLYMYDIAEQLKNLGYNVVMLYKKDKDPRNFLDSGHAQLQHATFNDSLQIRAWDFIVVPDYLLQQNYKDVMTATQGKWLPCETIVISRSMNTAFAFNDLKATWSVLRANHAIVTSQSMVDDLQYLMPANTFHIVNPKVSDYFTVNRPRPRQPKVLLLSKEQFLLQYVIKKFYLKYPHLGFISFDVVDYQTPMPILREKLAESAIAVWIDQHASYGTFPIEAACQKTPCVMLQTDSMPEWLEYMIRFIGEDVNPIQGLHDKFGVYIAKNKNDLDEKIAAAVSEFLYSKSPQISDDAVEYLKSACGKEPFTLQVTNAAKQIVDSRISLYTQLLEKTKTDEK